MEMLSVSELKFLYGTCLTEEKTKTKTKILYQLFLPGFIPFSFVLSYDVVIISVRQLLQAFIL